MSWEKTQNGDCTGLTCSSNGRNSARQTIERRIVPNYYYCSVFRPQDYTGNSTLNDIRASLERLYVDRIFNGDIIDDYEINVMWDKYTGMIESGDIQNQKPTSDIGAGKIIKSLTHEKLKSNVLYHHIAEAGNQYVDATGTLYTTERDVVVGTTAPSPGGGGGDPITKTIPALGNKVSADISTTYYSVGTVIKAVDVKKLLKWLLIMTAQCVCDTNSVKCCWCNYVCGCNY